MDAVAVQAIGYSGALLITHRLDRCTEGLTMIGKSPDFVRRFNDLLQNRKGSVRKFYRTLTTVPPPLGAEPARQCISSTELYRLQAEQRPSSLEEVVHCMHACTGLMLLAQAARHSRTVLSERKLYQFERSAQER